MDIKLKEEFNDTVIGFNNSAEPLGKRKDLHLLLKDAKAGNVKYILDMFEEIPSDDELKTIQGQNFLLGQNTTSDTSDN
jgi:hypothetical protein